MTFNFSNVGDFQPLDEIDVHLGDERYITVRYGGTSNRPYQSALRRFAMKHRRALANGTLAIEDSDRAEREAFARHVVTGWRGFENGTAEIPFSVEACVALFEQYPALFFQLQDEATTLANFRADDLEAGKEALGN